MAKAIEGEVINQKDYQAYEKRMEIWRDSRETAAEKLSRGWQALWEIDQEELYKKAHGMSKKDWLKELSVHEGLSNGDFYRTMGMAKNFLDNGVPEKLVWEVMGKQMTAMKVDLAEAFVQKGKNKGQLLPEVKERIEEEYGSLAKLVENINGQGKGAARQSVSKVLAKDSVFALDDAVVFNPQRNELLVNVRWDDEGGLVGIYTLKITATNITEGVEVKDPKHLPERIARWVGDKLGVKV